MLTHSLTWMMRQLWEWWMGNLSAVLHFNRGFLGTVREVRNGSLRAAHIPVWCDQFFTYHVKLRSSLWKHFAKNTLSLSPLLPVILNTLNTAQAWTGGFTSSNANSYAGIYKWTLILLVNYLFVTNNLSLPSLTSHLQHSEHTPGTSNRIHANKPQLTCWNLQLNNIYSFMFQIIFKQHHLD